MRSAPAITRIEASDVTYALADPLIVGGKLVSARHYTFVRVTSSEGKQGQAYALTRGLPISTVVERLVGPQIIDVEASPTDLSSLVSNGLGPIAADTCVRRALSLMDIALWDLIGITEGKPVFQLFQEEKGPSPQVIVVEGYMPATGHTDVVRNRIAKAVDEGRTLIKFSTSKDPRETRAAIDAVAPQSLTGDAAVIVDLLWTLNSAAAGEAWSRALDQVSVEWIEDPFPGNMLRARPELRPSLAQEVAYGDEATDPDLLYELMEKNRLDVLRIDATTLGGISGAKAVVERARQSGVPTSCHIYPEIHQHLAFSQPRVDFLEFFPLDGRYDATDRFRTSSVSLDGPKIAMPAQPGLGLGLDWESIHRDAHVSIVLHGSTTT